MHYSLNRTTQALGELQTTLHWKLTIIKPANAVGDLPEDVEIRCTSATVPESVEELNKLQIAGHTINYVGKTSKNGQITLTFTDGTDTAATDYFTKWSAARWQGDGADTTGVQTLTQDLKADIRLDMMDPQDKVTQSYTLIGSITSLVRNINLSQTADPLAMSVNVEYDDFHYESAVSGTKW